MDFEKLWRQDRVPGVLVCTFSVEEILELYRVRLQASKFRVGD